MTCCWHVSRCCTLSLDLLFWELAATGAVRRAKVHKQPATSADFSTLSFQTYHHKTVVSWHTIVLLVCCTEGVLAFGAVVVLIGVGGAAAAFTL